VSLELACSNHILPSQLNYGRPEGDLTPRGGAPGYPVRFLRKPGLPHRFSAGANGHWRLISHLTLNHHALAEEGLPALRELLTLYDLPRSPATQRQVRGVTGLAHSPTTAWWRGKHGASLVHGIEVRLTLDEEAFAGSGMHLFVQVIDRFLGQYVHLNCFTEVVILSHNTGE
jgi:type VI secretion system protein ImpG